MKAFLIAIALMSSTAAQALTLEQENGLRIIGQNTALDRFCDTHTLRKLEAIKKRFHLDDAILERSRPIIDEAKRKKTADIDANPSSCAASRQLEEQY
jgi:hypothetical protein